MTTRILLVRFSSIGDIVLTTPVVRALKQQLDGEVQIDYLTKKSYASIVEANPNVDQVITIEQQVSEVADFLKDQMYDYIVDLHHNIRSAQVKRAAKSLAFTVDKRNLAKWIYVQTKRELLPIGHFADRCLETVRPLGVSDDGGGLDYYIPSTQDVSLNSLPEAFRSGYVAYAIGGQMEGKILPAEKMIALCEMIEKPVLLIGGKDDAARAQEVVAASGKHVHEVCGQYTLHQSASLIKQAEVVLTHDTGLMHIAAAFKKRIISMWFATTPELGFAPWRAGEGSVMVEAVCSKRPTSKLGNRGYQDGCVYRIDLASIASTVNEN